MTDYTFLLGWALFRPSAKAVTHPAITTGIISGSKCQCDIRPHFMNEVDEGEDLIAFLYSNPREHVANDHFSFTFLRSLESVMLMQERWPAKGYTPLAMAMRPQDAQLLDDTLREAFTRSNLSNPNYQYEALASQKFSGNERIVGYDVLGYRWGWESFLCNGLDKELASVFKGFLSPQGLITDAEIAAKFAQYINDNDAGEPGCLYLSYAFLAPE